MKNKLFFNSLNIRLILLEDEHWTKKAYWAKLLKKIIFENVGFNKSTS